MHSLHSIHSLHIFHSLHSLHYLHSLHSLHILLHLYLPTIILINSIASLSCKACPTGHKCTMTGGDWSRDSRLLMTYGDRSAILWHLNTPDPVMTIDSELHNLHGSSGEVTQDFYATQTHITSCLNTDNLKLSIS